MENWKGCTALVTGASSGIGEGITKRLTSEGVKVVGCGRNFERLEALKKELKNPENFHPIRCDVGEQDQVEKMFEEIKRIFGGVDICINNAGLAFMDTLLDGDPQTWKTTFNVNVLGLCMCTKYAVASMRERDVAGYVIHINSRGGHSLDRGVMHFYCATKFAVTALTEGLRQELREIKSKIRISSISPGFVETEFADRIFTGKTGKTEEVMQKMKTALDLKQGLLPEDIAANVVHLLSMPQHVQIHDIKVYNSNK